MPSEEGRKRDRRAEQMNLTFAGAALAAISFALVILARVQLGKSFAVTPIAKDLVTHGLYSRLQHPMYVFVDFAVCGFALAVGRWYVLLPLVILLLIQTRNARAERKLSKRSLESAMKCIAGQHGFNQLGGETSKPPGAARPSGQSLRLPR